MGSARNSRNDNRAAGGSCGFGAAACCREESTDDEDDDGEDEEAWSSERKPDSLSSGDEEDEDEDSDILQEGTDRSADRESSRMPPGGIFNPSLRGAYIGFCAQYFAVGVIGNGMAGCMYGFFLGYLNVPAYVYSTVGTVVTLPWSFKVFAGILNDLVPIRGMQRKPYMVIGWSICALALWTLALTPLPEPYWCIDPDTGTYIMERTLPGGRTGKAEPCHPESAKMAGVYAGLMLLATLGYLIADVAADGLTTEYARCEPLARRGKTQTTAYFARSIGGSIISLAIGLCMNGKLYNGTFSWSLSFNTVCACLGVPAALMVVVSAVLVREPEGKQRMACGEYFALTWKFLRGRACLYVVLYNFFGTAISSVSTTAGPLVKEHWAGVENLQNQLFTMVGSGLFALGLWIVREKLLNVNWWIIILTTIVGLNLVDFAFTTITIFDVFRNQYFYLGETVLVEIPLAANFVVSTFVVVEMADDGNEGLVYGFLTTASNLGMPVANAISNQIFSPFRPSLSEAGNYIADEPDFRWEVFYSFLISYGFSFLALPLLYFLPRQKKEALERKRNWESRAAYGVFTLGLLSCAFLYSLSVNILAMFPQTMCLQYAGGEGCGEQDS